MRNRILDKALKLQAEILVGIDDVIVAEYWLKKLWEARTKYKATIVSVPCLAVFEEALSSWILEGDFSRQKMFVEVTPREGRREVVTIC